MWQLSLGLLHLLAGGACARPVVGGAPPAVSPGSETIAPVALPPIPSVTGRLQLRVVHPPAGSLIGVDSTFVFGSTGSGGARLSINGTDVEVRPNGSFLTFLAVPPAPESRYRVVAIQGADTARLEVAIRRPRAPLPLPEGGPLAVDSASIAPAAGLWRLPGDRVPVMVRATPSAEVLLRTAEGTRALGAQPGNGARREGEVPARWLAAGGLLVARRGADSVSLPVPAVRLLDEEALPLGVVGAAPATLPDSERVVVARPIAGGTYKWFLLPGTVVPITGRTGDALRIRLDRDLDAWVDAADVRLLDSTAVRPRRVAGNGRVVARPWGSELVIPMGAAPVHAVDVTPTGLEVTLHGVVGNTDILNYASADSFVRRVTWEQLGVDRVRYRVETAEAPWGYVTRFERGQFTVRIRRAPQVEDRTRPLAGRLIAVDAGHPPAGSTGPTGLYEAVATLAISERLRALLEARGARVLMTRTGPGALGLPERPAAATRANADVFVSIHLNALPDGVRPERAHGTGTYYFTPMSVGLARDVQQGMVRRLGLRDLGINYDNLAVIRGTWMPSVLCEGAFLIIPEQEAALRTPEYQDAYARGVVEGLERWFARLAVR